MKVCEQRVVSREADQLAGCAAAFGQFSCIDGVPIRFVVTGRGANGFACEIGYVQGQPPAALSGLDIFKLNRRSLELTDRFNVVMVVPTGIGASVGGHAGDATPAARLLGQVCDTLILHPNVVNASDINEMPANALYVEGSVLARFLMGTVALQPVRSNRLLVLVGEHEEGQWTSAAINAVNAAWATRGVKSTIVRMSPMPVLRSEFAGSGRATGVVEDFGAFLRVIDAHLDGHDAIAVTSVVNLAPTVRDDYYARLAQGADNVPNPWGGVEALLTHAISSVYDVPAAHAPMMPSQKVADLDYGVVDPRIAAEDISLTFLNCVLKGLHRSPKILTDFQFGMRGALTVADVSALVIPDGCVGLPTLAALEQGIPVIVIADKNLMRNDLDKLPWQLAQLCRVENYWEAAGVLAAMRGGICPWSVRRPIGQLHEEGAQ